MTTSAQALEEIEAMERGTARSSIGSATNYRRALQIAREALAEVERLELESGTEIAALLVKAQTLAEENEKLTAAIEKFRERLEITHAYQMVDGRMVKVPAPDGMPDGIECRDDTIKLLESSARATEERTQRLRGALHDILAIEYPAAKDVGHPTEVAALVARCHVIARAVLGDQT